MSHNLERLKAAYQAWDNSKGKSIDTWLAIMADSCDFRSLANGTKSLEFSAPRTTRAEVRGYLEALTGAWEMIHYTPRFFMQDGDRIAVFGDTAWKCRHNGERVETLIATFWRFEGDRAVEFSELYDTGEMMRVAAL